MNAVIAPIADVDPLARAVAEYINAKRDEEHAAARRLRAEELILSLHPAREEGSDTFDAGGYKVTVTGKLSYSMSCEPRTLEQVWHEIGDTAGDVPVPLKSKVELDATGAKWIRQNRPDLWAFLSKVVTIKPAKTAISVKV